MCPVVYGSVPPRARSVRAKHKCETSDNNHASMNRACTLKYFEDGCANKLTFRLLTNDVQTCMCIPFVQGRCATTIVRSNILTTDVQPCLYMKELFKVDEQERVHI